MCAVAQITIQFLDSLGDLPPPNLSVLCDCFLGPEMILCIDDEATGLRIRKMLLQTQGYEVVTASSGPEGLELLDAYPFTAVVVDYSMPGMNGGEVAAEIKRRNSKVKILMLSAYVDLPEEALKWVDKRSVKGVAPTSLLADLAQLLSC